MRKGLRRVCGFVTNLRGSDIMKNLMATKKQLICLKVNSYEQQKELYDFIKEFGIYTDNADRESILSDSNIGSYIALSINNSTSYRFTWSTFNIYSINPSLIKGNRMEKHTGVGTIDSYTSFAKFKRTMLIDSGILNISKFYSPRVITK